MGNSAKEDSAKIVTESPLSNYLKRVGDCTSFTFNFWKGISQFTSSQEKINKAPHTLAAAVERCPVDVCKELLEAGADVNSSYPDGQTALMLAISARCHEKVELLLEYRPSCDGLHMYQYASEYGCENNTLQIISKHFGLEKNESHASEVSSVSEETILFFSTHISNCNIEELVTAVQQHQEICNLMIPELFTVLNKISQDTEMDPETRFVSFTPTLVGSVRDNTFALGDIDIACVLKYTDGINFRGNMLTVNEGSPWIACSDDNGALLPKLVTEKFIENFAKRWQKHAVPTACSVVQKWCFNKRDKVSCMRVLAACRTISYEVFVDMVPILNINDYSFVPKTSRHNNDLNAEDLRFTISRQSEERQRVIKLSNDQVSALKLAKILRICNICTLDETQQHHCHVISNFDKTSILTSYMLKQSLLNRPDTLTKVTLLEIIEQLAGDLEKGCVVSNIDRSTIFSCTHNKGVPVQDHTDEHVSEACCLKRVTALHLCNNIINWIKNHTDKTETLQAQLCQQPRPTRTALCWLEYKQWNPQKSVKLQFFRHSLRLIDDELWQCHDCGISVFTLDLEPVRHMPFGDLHTIYDVASTGRDEVVAATDKGLYSLNKYGSSTCRIDEDLFISVCLHEDQLYAAYFGACPNTDPNTVRVYRRSGSTWTESSCFRVEEGWVTLSVNNAGVYMCGQGQDKFYHYSHNGELLSSTGSQGSGIDEMYNPSLCSVDSAGTALIADWANNRLKLLSSRGTWSVIDLQPGVQLLRGALFYNGSLYVNSESNKRSLTMYI